jgi:hypothetical protein
MKKRKKKTVWMRSFERKKRKIEQKQHPQEKQKDNHLQQHIYSPHHFQNLDPDIDSNNDTDSNPLDPLE